MSALLSERRGLAGKRADAVILTGGSYAFNLL